jgi:hypothetical protein
MANEVLTIAVTIADAALLAAAAAAFGRRRARRGVRGERAADVQPVRVEAEARRRRDW